jgi:ElaB/YqjD/DUF883 family membrane-anchored ribosome-binding protein
MYISFANADTLHDSSSNALDQLQRAADPVIKEGKRQAGVLLDESGELLDTISTRVSESAADLAERLIAYTKNNPFTALLLAVGAGALLISAAKSIQAWR